LALQHENDVAFRVSGESFCRTSPRTSGLPRCWTVTDRPKQHDAIEQRNARNDHHLITPTFRSSVTSARTKTPAPGSRDHDGMVFPPMRTRSSAVGEAAFGLFTVSMRLRILPRVRFAI
jgi:hypothetical protein